MQSKIQGRRHAPAGPHDGGELPDDKCGELEDYVKVEDGVTVDLAWIKPTVEFENKLLGLGTPKGPIRKVEVGDELGAKTRQNYLKLRGGEVKRRHTRSGSSKVSRPNRGKSRSRTRS